MKKVIVSFLAIAAFVVAPVSVFAQVASATDQAIGRATLITPITIANETDLDFGTLAASSTVDGTVEVAASSATGTSALTALNGAQIITGTSAKAASFTVTGEGSKTFAITKPTNILLKKSGSPDLTVTLTGDGTGTLSSGTATIYVGGVLDVKAGATGGSYVSEGFNVTVAYN